MSSQVVCRPLTVQLIHYSDWDDNRSLCLFVGVPVTRFIHSFLPLAFLFALQIFFIRFSCILSVILQHLFVTVRLSALLSIRPSVCDDCSKVSHEFFMSNDDNCVCDALLWGWWVAANVYERVSGHFCLSWCVIVWTEWKQEQWIIATSTTTTTTNSWH